MYGAGETYVVNPNICPAHIHAIETALVTTANRHVVRLAVGTVKHNEMEHGRINEFDIVNREVVRLLDTQDPRTVSLAVLVVLVPIA